MQMNGMLPFAPLFASSVTHMQTHRVICHDVYANMSLLCSSQPVFVEYVMNLVSKLLGTTVKTCNMTLRQ